MLKEKIILVDCDGVLLDWVAKFDAWMSLRGYKKKHSNNYSLSVCYELDKIECKKLIRLFNESEHIQDLLPLNDSVEYVQKLHNEHGYKFHCITSLSLKTLPILRRRLNLVQLFGETVFEEIVCLDTGGDKDQALLKYKDTQCVWVEDKLENALVGRDLGLDVFLIGNKNTEEVEGVKKVGSWKEIYENINIKRN